MKPSGEHFRSKSPGLRTGENESVIESAETLRSCGSCVGVENVRKENE
jgi:hypothetical protein